MNKSDYMALMNFPGEWIELDMFPDELFEEIKDRYEPGHEDASEHDRNGIFHWWLKKQPEREVLLKLVELSYADPDQVMAADVRRYIAKSKHSDASVLSELQR